MEEIKLCKNCDFFNNNVYGYFCNHNKAIKHKDLIFGDDDYFTCKEMRETVKDKCGYHAIFFKNKK